MGPSRQPTPLYVAQHADRYARQDLIRQYEERTGAQLIVLIDAIFNASVTLLEELLVGMDSSRELHVLLASPGGDGEVAIRMIKSMQSACSRLVMVIPDMAKSAATLMCLGADEIVMCPSSDLGPIDPQFMVSGRGLVSAKEIQRAVATAEEAVATRPETFELYSGLLADVNMLMVEQATSALARTDTLLAEALACVASRAEADREALAEQLTGPLIKESSVHGATIGPEQAIKLGLPGTIIDRQEERWQLIWALWTRYFQLGCFPVGPMGVYENRQASQVTGPPTGGPS